MRITNVNELVKLTNEQIQKLLVEIEFNDFMILLDHIDGNAKKKVLSNVSKNVHNYIQEYKENTKYRRSNFVNEILDYIILQANSLLPQKIAIASDHAAFELKEAIKSNFNDIKFVDFGTDSLESMDYPDTGIKAAESVATKDCDLGIVLCGTGIGMSVATNKVKGIRAALCHTTDAAKMTRKHNNANVLVMAGRYISKYLAFEIVDTFLSTNFEGGRHQRRIDKITDYENNKK